MEQPEPQERHAPLLERIALKRLRRFDVGTAAPESVDAIHVLNSEELSALRRLQRMAVLRGFLGGAFFTLLAGLAQERWIPELLGSQHDDSLQTTITFWVLVALANALAAVIEIVILQADAIHTTYRIAHAAGLELFGDDQDRKVAIRSALARAALEMPCKREVLCGVDPYEEVVKWRLVVATLAYKAKIGVTNFLVKALIRRALGRAAVRSSLITFAAVPITGAWNAYIMWKVLRQVRLRVMGPSAVHEMVDMLVPREQSLSQGTKETLFRAVAVTVVRSREMHPNLAVMLQRLHERLGLTTEIHNPGSAPVFLERLEQLEPEDQELTTAALEAACAIDGRIGRRERRLLKQTEEALGKPGVLVERARALQATFVSGQPISRELLFGQ